MEGEVLRDRQGGSNRSFRTVARASAARARRSDGHRFCAVVDGALGRTLARPAGEVRAVPDGQGQGASYCGWIAMGAFDRLFAIIANEPDLQWLTRLRDVANEMDAEDGLIWVSGVGQDGIIAFRLQNRAPDRIHQDPQRKPQTAQALRSESAPAVTPDGYAFPSSTS